MQGKWLNFLEHNQTSKHVAHALARRDVNKWFWEVKVGKLVMWIGCEILNGSRKMHQVRFVSYQDPMLLQCCELSCFYVHCLD
jgi:hypothetical protein